MIWLLCRTKKSIHYISWTPCHEMSISGYASLSFVYAITYLNLPDINTDELFRKVDLSDEVCTLYPRVNITIYTDTSYSVLI